MEALDQQSGMKRIASSSSVAGMVLSNYGSIYSNVWKALQLLSADPSPLVTDVARKLVTRVKQKVRCCAEKGLLNVMCQVQLKPQLN